MHIHILGISGTFMSALAILAREAGFTVTGSDTSCYPPVRDLVTASNIHWVEGYDICPEFKQADMIVVGNAMKRGMPIIEAMLNMHKPYTSGPQWLAEHILTHYRVMAVAGTHGKTTTTSMLTHILEQAGLEPGFLIGGVAANVKTNARLGKGDWFVIEADEYDSAFFDKRPKLMHYHPDVAILNNLEFDHADIYPNLEAIQQQFHYFLRTIPSEGTVISPRDDSALEAVFAKGQYSHHEHIALSGNAAWQAKLLDENGQSFEIYHHQQKAAEITWSIMGKFNVENALAALAASTHAGVSPQQAARALEQFIPVKRRLEVKSNAHHITVYDDFAHHPTAIEKTLQALKNSHRHQRIFAVIEFASYTMRSGIHGDRMAQSLRDADEIYILNPTEFSIESLSGWSKRPHVLMTPEQIVSAIQEKVEPGDAVLVMSNRGFGNIHHQLTEAIHQKYTPQ